MKNDNDTIFKFIEDTYLKNMDTLQKKNADYSGSEENFFTNFTRVEEFGITSTEKGILVRLMDKYCRINNLLENKAQVTNESVYDTIDDAINYFAILKAYLYFSKQAGKSETHKFNDGLNL